MSEARGIVVHGVPLPGTERVIRSTEAWWSEPSTDIYPRRGHRIDRICGHWSGGHPHTGPEAGGKLFTSMLKRRKESGELMDVSCHFGIAADGGIWQFCDLSSATIHVIKRINLRSVGVEVMSPGLHSWAKKLGYDMPPVMGFARGQAVKAVAFTPEAIAAWRWLVATLCLAQHPMLSIPMQHGSLDKPGILEHHECGGPKSTKMDAAGLLLREVVPR
jgi:hypothetical protein